MSAKKGKKLVRVMFGCPSDAESFLEQMKEGLEKFNSQCGDMYGVSLKGCHWRDGTYSAAGNTQEIINGQLCKTCDLLIAVFYQSIGSAVSSEKPGTITEINYFRQNNKQAFVFKYTGKYVINLADDEELRKFGDYISEWKKQKDRIYYKEYKDSEELIAQIYSNLQLYFEERKKVKKNKKSYRQKNSQNILQNAMKEHLKVCDEWNGLGNHFKFEIKAEELIAGIKEDGSVQYYVGSAERYRTTPVASTLEALYLAGLLPKLVCHKMQDWVYNSRKDPCDEPGKPGITPAGHPPNPEDEPGWSWNEGVSVWATSKALYTLALTGFYDRPEVIENSEIQDTTRKALDWLAGQIYPSGGWGFQQMGSLEACSESVTMTALALRALTWFLKYLNLNDELEDKLSNAKQKGIEYLYREMKEKNKLAYWEYDGKPSLTATVWVLDFINMAGNQEAGKLYEKRREIRSFCLSRLPKTDAEYDDYKDEVYFTGGETKYKTIVRNHKFFSYMPYHIPILLNAGIPPIEDHIRVCIRALILGKEEYWNGTDKSPGHHQRKSCFVLAMALSVVAIWMKKMTKILLPSEISEKWDIERECDEENR